MKRSTIRLIIFVAALLLGALVVTQIVWVNRAYHLQETQVTYDITQSLKSVSEEVQKLTGDSSFVMDPVSQINDNTFIVKINETPDPIYIESVLTREFKNNEINLDFEYNLYNCFNDSVVYTKAVSINEGRAMEKDQPSVQVLWKSDDGHYFSVFFPNKSAIVLGRLQFWYYSSFLLVVIVLFFAYTIGVILKQKRLSEVKTDFINNMTHELKTPISTISLSSEVLLKPDIMDNPERLNNYAKIIQRENSRMQRQVEKVLQIASLEKDKPELKIQEIDVHQLIEEVGQTFEPLIKERSGTLTLNLRASNFSLKGDETHLSNVITNLIDNGIKYCEKAPEIVISTVDKGSFIEISVADNGIGIDKDSVAQVFEKFYRVPTGNRHDVKGFGLGLYYVKVMIEEHGGEIDVKSSPGKGSEFVIKLPIKT